MIRIIFLGPPGSGKGTQSILISNQYNIPNISAGEVLKQSFLDKKFALKLDIDRNISVINSGNLIADELVIKLIIARINQNDCKNGFLLDGFPRTIIQAKSIKKSNIFIDFVIEFYIPDSVVIDRIVGRQIHIESGRIYHIKFNPPKYPGLDDITGDKLVIREDDKENVVCQRLKQYYQHTIPISNFYKKQSKKKLVRYFMINGNRTISEIYLELIKIFQFPLNIK